MTGGAVLAVDGGGSKTDAWLVAADGSVLARASGGASNHQVVGLDAAVAVLTGLVEEVRSAAEVPGAVLQLCLAGADLPEEEALLLRALAPLAGGACAVLVNDVLALLRAGTSSPDAAAVVCGTGVNAVAVAADGSVARFPALGRVTGDWGGGHDLAAEALWHAVRAEDGRGPATALRERVPAVLERASAADVAADVHLGRLPVARLHALVPALLAVAAEGDAVARAVVERQADELALMASVVLRRVGLGDAPADVVLGGGVLAGSALVADGVRSRLAAAHPRVHPVLLDAPPVVGAALLGLDALHGGRTPAPVEAVLRSR